MRGLALIMAAVLVAAASMFGPMAGTAQAQTTTASLQASYAAKSVGSLSVCTNSGGCSVASPTVVPLNFASDAQGAADAAGNYCATATSASSPLVGSAVAAFSSTKVVTGSLTSFDSTTGQGDVTFNIYNGGSCTGAAFNSTGATLIATGTSHVVVSDSANRIDAIVTSYVSAAGKIGGVVDTVTLIRQTHQ